MGWKYHHLIDNSLWADRYIHSLFSKIHQNYLIDNEVDVATLKDYIKISTVRSNYGNYRINQLDKFEHVEDIFKKQNNHNSRVLANLNGEVKTIFDYLTKELDNGD